MHAGQTSKCHVYTCKMNNDFYLVGMGEKEMNSDYNPSSFNT